MVPKRDKATRDYRQADWLGPPMFYLSLVFIALLAAILVLWVDVTRTLEAIEGTGEAESFGLTAYRWGGYCGTMLLMLWPLFLAEQFYRFARRESLASFQREQPLWWLHIAMPPLRLCARRRASADQIWLPCLGWQVVDRSLQRRLERLFSIPMIWIALLILPVLGLQMYFQERIVEFPTLRIILHFGAGLIWFAFAVEFIVMISVADKKWAYCKKHWLDLAIILLPLLSFLRTLRILQLSRLIKVSKLHQLTRAMRIYRLRGVAMRGLRALLLLEVVHRVLRTSPEQRIRSLELRYREKQQELEDIKEEIRVLQSRLPAPSANASEV